MGERAGLTCLLLLVGLVFSQGEAIRAEEDRAPSLEFLPSTEVVPQPRSEERNQPKLLFTRSHGNYGLSRGSFDGPVDVVHDDLGGYYVVDSGNNRIQKFTENDRFEFQWGSRGSREGRFIRPQAIARDEDGNIFIVDTGNNRVQKFDDRGEFILEWGSLGSSPGKFMDPIDITFDDDGDIYILDAGNERIQKFSPSTAFEDEWGGFTGGRQGDFTRLVSIAFDDDRLGLLQLLGDGIEEGTCQIQILDLRGGRKEVVRSWDLAYPGDDEVPCFPTRIRIDNRDNYVYILDHVNSVLRRYQKDGRYLDSIWEVEEPMNGPMGLSIESGTRKIWIADTGSNAIQRFTLR